MKKQLATLIFSIISLGAYSQASTIWTPYGSDFNTNWGIRYLSAVDSNTVWAIGFHGSSNTATNMFTKTGNGTTFIAGTFLPDTNTFSASSIYALDSNTAFISIYDKAGDGTSGQILKTNNAGIDWTNIASDSMFLRINNFPDFVYFWNADTGIAVGDPNGNTSGTATQMFEIWQTTNGGTNWVRVADTLNPIPQTNEYGLSSSYAVYGQKVWFGTSTGRVYSSSDSSKWVAYPTGLYGGANGLAFRDSLHGLVWGFVNSTTQTISVLNTVNGGITWNPIAANQYIGKTDFCAIPGTDGFMSVGLDGAASSYVTSVTHDDGADWTTLESNTSNTEKISRIQMTDTLHGWSGTSTTNSTNGINKYKGPNVAGIEQFSIQHLAFSIFPNPATDMVNIEGLALNQNNTLVITDMLGNTIKQFKIQNSAFSVNVADMEKGVYLLKMQNGISTQVQKLIIQ